MPLISQRLHTLLTGNSLKAREMRGSFWVMLGYVLSQALRLASNLLLTRLLLPEAFGVMAIVHTITTGLVMFSDIGLMASLMRSQRLDDEKFLDTAWTFQVLRSLVIWVVSILIAMPLARFYGYPEITYLLPLSCFSVVLAGFYPIKVLLANKQLRLFKITFFPIAAQVVGLVAMAIVAFYTKHVSALAIGGLVTNFVLLFFYMGALEGRNNRFFIEGAAFSELFTVGKWVFVSSAFTFLVDGMPKLILGKVLSGEHMGVYAVGLVLAVLPSLVVSMLSGRVLLPLFGEAEKDQAGALKIIQARRLLMLAGFMGVSVVALVSPLFFALLYTDAYKMSGYISALFVLATVPDIAIASVDRRFVSTGRNDLQALYKSLHFTVLLFLLLALVPVYGLLGSLMASSVASLLVYLAMQARTEIREVTHPVQELVGFVIWFMMIACVVALFFDEVQILLREFR